MSPFNQSGYDISNYFLAFCLLEEFLTTKNGVNMEDLLTNVCGRIMCTASSHQAPGVHTALPIRRHSGIIRP